MIDDYIQSGFATFVGSIAGVSGFGVLRVFNAGVYIEQSIYFLDTNKDSAKLLIRFRLDKKQWSKWIIKQ